MAIDPSVYPALNAALNGTSAVLIASGRQLIGRKKVFAHRNCMIAAVITSSLFLTSYLYYHFAIRHGQATHFQGQGFVRPLYFALLLSHTILAAVIVPLILVTLSRGLRERFDAHRQIARWTYPLWMYVSVTGVLIYFMLYHWFV